MKKSVEQLAAFYSGGSEIFDAPWRGTTEHSGPVYFDEQSLLNSLTAREQSVKARETTVSNDGRIIRKPLGAGIIDNY